MAGIPRVDIPRPFPLGGSGGWVAGMAPTGRRRALLKVATLCGQIVVICEAGRIAVDDLGRDEELAVCLALLDPLVLLDDVLGHLDDEHVVAVRAVPHLAGQVGATPVTETALHDLLTIGGPVVEAHPTLPPLWQIARVAPQHPLQLLDSQSPSETSPRVFLGSVDERLTEALVQPGAAVVVGSGDVPFWIAYDDE